MIQLDFTANNAHDMVSYVETLIRDNPKCQDYELYCDGHSAIIHMDAIDAMMLAGACHKGIKTFIDVLNDYDVHTVENAIRAMHENGYVSYLAWAFNVRYENIRNLSAMQLLLVYNGEHRRLHGIWSNDNL